MSSKPEMIGVVLAGGKSARMGQDKALIPVDGKALVLHVMEALLEVLSKVALIQARPGHLDSLIKPYAECVLLLSDERPYQGPLPALARACREFSPAPLLVAACDTPFLSQKLISHLCQQHQPNHLATVFEVDGILQPLLAVYNSERVLEYLSSHSVEDLHSPQQLLQSNRAQVHVIPASAIAALDPERRSFRNCNRPEDLSSF